MKLLFSTLILICLLSSQALAHAPYLIKQGFITAPNGRKIIKEHLYGDGIITNDPVIFQLRNNKGAVLAKSTTGTNIASICPNIKFCIVVPYGAIFPFGKGFILDADDIDFDKAKEDYDFQYDEADSFEKYLTDEEEKRISSYTFGYPQRNATQSGFKQSLLITLLSPTLIVADQILVLIPLLLTMLLISRGERSPSKTKNIKNKFFRYSAHLGISLITAIFISTLIITTFLITNFLFATPIFCLILIWTLSWFIKRKWHPKT